MYGRLPTSRSLDAKYKNPGPSGRTRRHVNRRVIKQTHYEKVAEGDILVRRPVIGTVVSRNEVADILIDTNIRLWCCRCFGEKLTSWTTKKTQSATFILSFRNHYCTIPIQNGRTSASITPGLHVLRKLEKCQNNCIYAFTNCTWCWPTIIVREVAFNGYVFVRRYFLLNLFN